MVMYCVACGCNNKAAKGSKISFHSFPSDSNIVKQWILALRRDKFKPSKYSRVCSEHFKKEDFLFNFGRNTVKQGAIPSIFNFREHLQKKILKKRSKRPKREKTSTFQDQEISIPSSECEDKLGTYSASQVDHKMKRNIGQRGRVINAQSRELVANVIHFMKNEAAAYAATGNPNIPLSNYKQRVLAATGISHKTYESILKEYATIALGASTSFSTPRRKKTKRSSKSSVKQEVEQITLNVHDEFQMVREGSPTVKVEIMEPEVTESF